MWNQFRETPEQMDSIKCWVVKGTFNEKTGAVEGACASCKYYLMQNGPESVVSDYNNNLAIITLSGTINAAKAAALLKVYGTLEEYKKKIIVIDVSRATLIYSVGLSALVRIHQDLEQKKGEMLIAGASPVLMQIFETARLAKLFSFVKSKEAVADRAAAKERAEAEAKAAERNALAAAEKAAQEAEAKSQRDAEDVKPPMPTRKFVRCFEYWNNHNPKNVNTCDECFRKINPSNTPCWVVEGELDGVSFQFVNEDCVDCKYFEEFGLKHKG